MTTFHWLVGVWVVSAIIFIAYERLDPGVSAWDSKEPWSSGVKYGLLLLLSPIVVSCGAGYWSWVGWRKLIGKPVWLDDDILVRLIKRRQKYDVSLKDENIDDWPARRTWGEPEYLVHDISRKYLTLKSEGVCQPQIFQKLEAFRAEFGNGNMPSSPTLEAYVKYRLDIEAPEYAAFGEELLHQQLKDCRAHVLYKIDKTAKAADYLSPNVLGRRLTEKEVKQLGVGSKSITFRRDMFNLRFRMHDDDEIWTYSALPTAGVTLVRDGKLVDHVITTWMCGGNGSNAERVPLPVPFPEPFEKIA